jgi:hypothetical protein
MAMATATHDGGSDLSMLGAMRLLRPSLMAIITCLGLAACGGASHSSTSSATTSAPPTPATIATTASATTSSSAERAATTTTTSTASAPPEVPKTKTHAHPGEGGGHGGVSSGAHVEANVSIAASGALSPPVVSVPSGVGVELHVTNHGGAAATIALSTPGHPSVHVAPGASGTLKTGGLKDGTYRILVNGSPKGQLMIGAQGGP